MDQVSTSRKKQVHRPHPPLEFEECFQNLEINIRLVDSFLKQSIKKIALKKKSAVSTVEEHFESSEELINEKILEFEECRKKLPQTNKKCAKKDIVQNIIATLNEAKNNICTLIIKIKKAKELVQSFNGDKDAENKITIIFEDVKVLANQTKASLSSVCLNDGKKLDILWDTSEIYSSANGSRVYVEVVANYDFGSSNLKELPGITKDIKKIRSTLNDKKKYELHIHENESLEETEQILEKWTTQKFDKNNSIVVIIDTHGKERHIITADGESIPHSRIWQCFQKNPHLGNKPVLIIFEACRGLGLEEVMDVQNDETKSQIFENYNYSPSSQGFIVVYASAYACAAYAPKKEGSHFLQQFLPLLKEKPEWDVLAQITKATQNILNKIEPTKVLDVNNVQTKQSNQTVTYVSLLHKQWKLSWTQGMDTWNDIYMDLYSTEEITAIVAVHETIQKENAESLLTLKSAMENCGIKICQQITRIPTEAEVKMLGNNEKASAVLLLVIGLETKVQFTDATLPQLRKILNEYEKYPALKGRPKLIFSLGPSLNNGKNKNISSPKKVEQSKEEQESSATKARGVVSTERVTEHSDVLAYCDQAEGCLEAMLEMFEHAAGNEEGLVRLLTRHVMSRQEALLSDQTPFIESTLLKKFVFQKLQ